MINYKQKKKWIIENVKKFINDSIYIDKENDNIKFDYADNQNNKSGINTNFGKKGIKRNNTDLNIIPRTTKLKNSQVNVISIYSKDASPESNEILLALKNKSLKYKVNKQDYETFINRTAIAFMSLIKNKSIDSILLMQSSSTLIKDIADVLVTKMPNVNIKLINNGIIKNIDNLTLDIPDNLNDAAKKDLERSFNKIKDNQKFEIKKILGRFRQFFKNWIEINDDIIKHVTDKNVVILDDYIISGTTLDEVCSTLQNKLNTKSITVLTILKSK